MDDIQQFLAEMARGADATTHQLELQETKLREMLGPERALELELLWAKQLDPADEEEIKRYMDWRDKELIWTWSRLERSRQRRIAAGRTHMIRSQEDSTSDGLDGRGRPSKPPEC
ncbi:hypothetical protein AUC68_02985 [Methyloceanibacter methanicus]|uniref:Uncharacterized protein n=1 Tax=Methyloceanibacter methanicus TaxID=1774968 RepID=A0A1E3W2Q9_9HYPH|nr:hypothetical protein [Methyloceanibacter methanicus]ODS00099.1 hypothetical protein AUC68_02985 [Methyloceanibacter methanicus]